MNYKVKYLKYKNKYLVLKKQYGGLLTNEQKELLKKAGFEEGVIDSLAMQDTDPSYIAGIIAEAQKAIRLGQPAYVDNSKKNLDYLRDITIQENNIKDLIEELHRKEEIYNNLFKSLHQGGLNFTIDEIRLLFNHGWNIDSINEVGLQITPELKNKIIQDLSKLPLQIPKDIQIIMRKIEFAIDRLKSTLNRYTTNT